MSSGWGGPAGRGDLPLKVFLAAIGQAARAASVGMLAAGREPQAIRREILNRIWEALPPAGPEAEDNDAALAAAATAIDRALAPAG